jgi:hypothetical protein
MPSCSNMGGDIMNRKSSPKPTRHLKRESPFEIPNVAWSHEKELNEIVSSVVGNKTAPRQEQATEGADMPLDYLKALVSIATNAWRAKIKMLDATTGEVREEMKRVDRHIEAIYRILSEVGIVIRDHTKDAYDEGQPMKVVASKPTPGLEKDRVSETLLPSVFWNNRLVQNGEIVIATPATSTPTTLSQCQPS